jgi:hypothetical protein
MKDKRLIVGSILLLTAFFEPELRGLMQRLQSLTVEVDRHDKVKISADFYERQKMRKCEQCTLQRR